MAIDEGMDSAPKIVVPNLNKDPVWSLRPWPTTLILGGQEFAIPALSAADWLAYLMQPQPDLDGFILDHLASTEEMLFDGVLDVDDLYDWMLDLISTVCARPWWVALRLVNVARLSWHILGPKMLESVDAERVSIAGWLDVLLIKTIESMDPKDTMMFSSELELPPREIAEMLPAPIDEMEMDRQAFLSMQ